MKRLLVIAAKGDDLRWIEDRTGVRFTADVRGIQAIDSTGRIRGQCAYDGWTENAVMIHIAVDSPMAWRALLEPGLEYPFIQGGRGVVIGLIAHSNRKACTFARLVGFRETARIQDGHAPGDDLVLFQLRKEDWLTERTHSLARRSHPLSERRAA